MPAELEKEDKVISEFLKSIGPWKKHIVIGGGYAPIIYKLYLANQKVGPPPIGTRDIDSLIPRRIPKASQNNIANHLKSAGFVQFFKDRENPATEAYVKEIDGSEVEIEFLTDNSTRKNKYRNIIISGVSAQPLSYLNLSIQETMEFETNSGETGLVVLPAAWVLHKGLTFLKRNSKNKIYKDLYGIWYVGTQLGDFSNEMISELHVLAQKNPKWFKSFKGNLSKWIKNAAPIDWIHLESQDPHGKLKKTTFKRIIKKIINEESS